jgi:hypothetical protein
MKAKTGGGGGTGAEATAGFWLPAALRASLITSDTQWQEVRFAGGRECGTECGAHEAGAVAARWPVLTGSQWAPTPVRAATRP